MTESVFVSYRRDDAAAEAHSIVRSVREKIGEDSVFFDTSSIDLGDSWPEKLREKIINATIVIAVIGTDWIRIADQWGRRRLDDPDDWVRKEIEEAISSKALLLPVLVKASKMPPREVLPESIQDIASKQAIEIRRDYWDHDIQLLLARLGRTNSVSLGDKVDSGPFPHSPYLPPEATDKEKLKVIIETDLPDWSVVATPLPSSPSEVRVEITREFRFKSFQAVIGFMSAVAPGCDIADHHPRWENIWKTLYVRLSTWDGELHEVTDRDVKLARYFDRAYLDFDGSEIS